ncbi:M20 family metallopeptidase [Nocardia xishanensis]
MKNDVAGLKKSVSARIDSLAPDLIGLSRQIHALPEIAFEEHESARAIASTAGIHGIEVTSPAFGLPTAFSAEFGDQSGPKVAIISEYDALPGIGHACGHNVIAAIGLGATIALRGSADRLPGSIRYLGTPGEERGCGKELMARAGAFDDVDVAMMVHPAGVNLKAIRTMCIAEVDAAYSGRAAHAALNPEAGRNALDAVVLSYQAIGQLRQHIASSQQIHGIITNGGAAPNIVPDRTTAKYFVRAADKESLDYIKKRVHACLHAGADATGCEADIRWSEIDYLDMKINLPLADAYEANAVSLGRRFTDYLSVPPGGTDMANISHRVPVLHPIIACAPPSVMIHDAAFTEWAASEDGDRAVIDGAKALAMTAIDYLCDEELQKNVTAAFAGSNPS